MNDTQESTLLDAGAVRGHGGHVQMGLSTLAEAADQPRHSGPNRVVYRPPSEQGESVRGLDASVANVDASGITQQSGALVVICGYQSSVSRVGGRWCHKSGLQAPTLAALAEGLLAARPAPTPAMLAHGAEFGNDDTCKCGAKFYDHRELRAHGLDAIELEAALAARAAA